MLSYYQAITTATELGNMPDPVAYPGKYIQWAEDICQLLSDIYAVRYEQVTQDMSEALGLLEENN